MPSFDIVSQVNSMEIENAVNIAKKELANRFDFKGSTAEIVLEKNEIKLSAENQFRVKALAEIVISKIAKRNINLKSVERCEPEVSPLGHARQLFKIKQGIATDVAKQVTGFIREAKFKVTTQIQDQQVRVTGKSRDDLQAVIAAVRAKDFPVALQFTNFRD
jgi:uncharacterized protein YajQ (UPF0234 family)